MNKDSIASAKSCSFQVKMPSIDGSDPARGPHAIADMAASLLGQAKDSAVRLLNRPWHKRQVVWDDGVWDTLEHHSTAYDTQSLMISCGTVTIDRPASPDRMVLLIWNKNTGAVSDPGRVGWRAPRTGVGLYVRSSTRTVSRHHASCRPPYTS
jgi:hypothetical protein